MQLDDVTNKLVEAMRHALNTDQIPDGWTLAPKTYVEIARAMGPLLEFKAVSSDAYLMGLKMIMDTNLPDGRFVLKSGRNTVFAGNIYEDPNEPA